MFGFSNHVQGLVLYILSFVNVSIKFDEPYLQFYQYAMIINFFKVTQQIFSQNLQENLSGPFNRIFQRFPQKLPHFTFSKT